MSITTMCDADDPGAYEYPNARNIGWCCDKPLYVHETHKGLVLSMFERNGYDDSDFYAVVWNPEKRCPEQIEYASTRGWSYCNTASVDATPETLAAYQAWQDEQHRVEQARLAKREKQTPAKGKLVRVIKGRKVPLDTEGTVFWIGRQREFGTLPRNGYVAHDREMHAYARSLGVLDPRDGLRVGFITESGEKFFTNAMNIEVLP